MYEGKILFENEINVLNLKIIGWCSSHIVIKIRKQTQSVNLPFFRINMFNAAQLFNEKIQKSSRILKKKLQFKYLLFQFMNSIKMKCVTLK